MHVVCNVLLCSYIVSVHVHVHNSVLCCDNHVISTPTITGTEVSSPLWLNQILCSPLPPFVSLPCPPSSTGWEYQDGLKANSIAERKDIYFKP